MDEEKLEEREETTEESEDNREEETRDEIRDEDYVNDDEIEMDRSIESRLDDFEGKVMGKLDSIFDTISMFVDSGMVIREANPLDSGEITEGEDFAGDYMSIDELDFSID